MPSNTAQLPPRAERQVFKSPFQASTTDDFRRSSDSATGVGAPRQEIYLAAMNANTDNNRNEVWKNSVGQEKYESTMLPLAKPLGGKVEKRGYATNPTQSSAS
jgi:hypothetical protein